MSKQFHYQQYHKSVTMLFILIWLLSLFLLPSAASASDDTQYFPETGKTVSGKFLSYWRDNGGLPVFGYPITEAQNEVDPETGKTFLTQWFERNRFELHPENAGTRFEVLLGLLGKDLQRDAIVADPSFQHAEPKGGATYFTETGHNLEGAFLNYWQANGGLARFGYPISEARSEGSYETGKMLWTQWFERARFEYHPLNKAPYDVLLGLLGNQIKTHPPVKNGESHVAWEKKTNLDLLYYPIIKAVDEQGNLFLFNTTLINQFNNIDQRMFAASYDQKGNLIRRITNLIREPEESSSLSDFTTDQQGNSYVLVPLINPSGYRTKIFNKNGELTSSWFVSSRSTPTSIAVDGVGNVYIAEYWTLKKYDVQGNLLATLVNFEENQFSRLVDKVTVDKQNNVYVSLRDTDKNKLYKYDAQGKSIYQRDIIIPGSEKEQYNLMTVDNSGNVLIGGGYVGYIAKFSPQGDLLAKWSGIDNFSYFSGIAVDSQNNIYLSGGGKPYLLKLDNNGKLISRLGEPTADSAKCYSSVGLVNNQVLAVDPYLGNVQRISPDGQFSDNLVLQGTEKPTKVFTANQKIYTIQGPKMYRYTGNGQPAGELDTSSTYILSTVDLAIDKQEKIYAIYTSLKGGVYFNGVAYQSVVSPRIDTDGNLYLVGRFPPNTNDYFAGLYETPRIMKYDSSNMQQTGQWSKNGSGDGEFLSAILAIDPQNRLYMLDGTLGRVQQFDKNGKLLAKWFDPRLKAITSFQVDGQGNLYGARGCDLVKFTLN